jgi:hypothetical protein
VHQGTTLLFSSGCGGCQVHEGWLPQVRASGHDVRLRETGAEHAAQTARFDAFMARCAPEVIDAVGVPGCVPNYACVADGRVFKVRSGENSVAHEVELNSAEDVGRFASQCAQDASRFYRARGGACVRFQLRGNTVCGNRAADVRAAAGARRFGGGANDACGTAENWGEEGGASPDAGCARPCPASLDEASLAASAAAAAGLGAFAAAANDPGGAGALMSVDPGSSAAAAGTAAVVPGGPSASRQSDAGASARAGARTAERGRGGGGGGKGGASGWLFAGAAVLAAAGAAGAFALRGRRGRG